uniref:CARD domain-containing protein n=1 Tax=Kryptolebias marmoratus TaxID=37003 RepID=A0A3Q3EX44_KRYMA
MDELQRIRPEFVERMSPEMLNQLLDGLEADGVFNSLEKEAILERNQTTADKARNLIDDVKKKGEKACIKMIEQFHIGYTKRATRENPDSA